MLRDLFSLFPAYAGVILIVVCAVQLRKQSLFPAYAGVIRYCYVWPSLRILFPAYAGVIPIRQFLHCHKNAFPRIRGGDPRLHGLVSFGSLFSPHTRG